jgi:hypothetical protein
MQRVIRYFLIIFLFFATKVFAGDDLMQVFQIVSDKCSSGPSRRLQTGFILGGHDGIITALHGVVDCSSIIARNVKQEKVFENLEVAEVDVQNDVALLRSPLLTNSKIPGLGAGDVPKVSARLWIVGHPQTLLVQHWVDLVLESSTKLLEDLIPLDKSTTDHILLRASPSMNNAILSVTGDIQPGHSGAPILNEEKKVIGIGNGGLKAGTVGIGWGIPLSAIDLKPKSERTAALKRLKEQNASLVFSFATEQGEISFALSPTNAKPGEKIILIMKDKIEGNLVVYFANRAVPKSTKTGGTNIEIIIPGDTLSAEYYVEIESGNRRFKSENTVVVNNPYDKFSFTVTPTKIQTGQEVTLHLSDEIGSRFNLYIYHTFARTPIPVAIKRVLSNGKILIVNVPENLSDGEFFFEMRNGNRKYTGGPIIVDNPKVHRAPPYSPNVAPGPKNLEIKN